VSRFAASCLLLVLVTGGSAAATAHAPAAPLTFAWPTSVELQRDGSLLVAENSAGRIVRVDPTTGRERVVVKNLYKPYAVATAPDGTIYWTSGGGSLERLRRGKHTTLLNLSEQPGPMTLGPSGAIYFATETQAFRFDKGRRRLIARGLHSPHGIAVTADGAVLISDRSADRVLRIANGQVTTLIHVSEPSGIDIARDGSIYLVEAGRQRVGHYTASGTRLNDVGPVFTDPYDVAAAADGTVYVLETAAAGSVVRVRRDGTVSTL
jgi:streptogramin lyase